MFAKYMKKGLAVGMACVIMAAGVWGSTVPVHAEEDVTVDETVDGGALVFTQYDFTMDEYAMEQFKRVGSYTQEEYRTVLAAANDNTDGFQYLRLDRFHEIDTKGYITLCRSFIKKYCEAANLDYTASSLYKKEKYLVKAAQKYELDPVYFACQTFLEAAYGTSTLGRGVTIKRVAYEDFRTKSGGKLKTKKLKKAVKVYNLYGIRAIDADPLVGGTSYAYYQGWTTVKKAIYGAASFVSDGYIHSGKYDQNTLFKIRYNPSRTNIWHQYATDAYYARKIGLKMKDFSELYTNRGQFVYDYPDWN